MCTRPAGLSCRHVQPVYNPHLATPLYSWQGPDSLLFTYTPFAAVAFAMVSFIPWSALQPLSVAVNIVLLLAALWVTFRALGYRDTRVRLGATLLTGAAVLWTEPGAVRCISARSHSPDGTDPVGPHAARHQAQPVVEGRGHRDRRRHQAGPC